MKTYSPSESLGLKTLASAWDQILDLGTSLKGAFYRMSHRNRLIAVWIMAFALVYFGLGFSRMVLVVGCGAKAIPDMFIDWWWVAFLRLVS